MCVLSLLIFAVALGNTPDQDHGASLDQLLQQLDAPELAKREQAEAELIRRGPAILDRLPRPSARVSPEVRGRLARIRQQLQASAQAGVAEGSRIHLPDDPRPLADLRELLARQSGNAIVDYRARFGQSATNPALAASVRQGEFWPVFDALLDQAELTLYPFGQRGALNVVQRGPHSTARSSRAVYRGAFRFEPIEIWLRESLRSQEPATLRLELELAWEPRVHPIYFRQRLADLSAIDDTGAPLEVFQGAAELEISLKPGAVATQLSIPFRAPPRAVREIQRMTGRMTALLPGEATTFRFPLGDPLPASQRVASATVTLDEVRRIEQRWEARLRLRFDEARDALQSHRGWVFQNEAFLEGPDGAIVKPVESETSLQSENELGMVYRFELKTRPAAYRLVYKSPTAILQREVAYEFRSIPLP